MQTPDLFLGVDGGGTKTDFALIDSNARVLARHQEAGTYHPEVGLAACAERLAAGTLRTVRIARRTVQDIAFAFFGLPAHGEDSRLLPQLDALPASVLPPGRYRCDNDMVCGWAGSLGCADGISVVAGTGSIAYGEFRGRAARAGGWGETFGDEGSAHWLACEGLRLFSRMSDGRTEPGALLQRVREHFGLQNDLDLCAAVYGAGGRPRSELATLARLVARAADDGDDQAAGLFDVAARELAALVHAVRRQLGVPAAVTLDVSYSGAVFTGNPLLRQRFAQALARHGAPYALTEPRFDPALGAALYAARCSAAASVSPAPPS